MDHTMRALLSKIGGMDYLVSEFVRVTAQKASALSLKRLVPELNNNAQTPYGHSVHVQLLGSNPLTLAATACNAVAAGATHIDLNFGCPAKRVNGHGGGSFLLQEPNELFEIVQSVRHALPLHIPLSAKMRLGYLDEALFMENLAAIEEAGASRLTIHGRTKKDGYGPPARWEKIGIARQASTMEIIANGDIYNQETLEHCRTVTGCNHFMIGRGSLANPFLFRELKGGKHGSTEELFAVIEDYMQTLAEHYDDFATLGRIKQWCAHLRRAWPVIDDNLKAIRSTQQTKELALLINELKRDNLR